MPIQVAAAAIQVRPLIERRLSLPDIIAKLPAFEAADVIEAYDLIRCCQFDAELQQGDLA